MFLSFLFLKAHSLSIKVNDEKANYDIFDGENSLSENSDGLYIRYLLKNNKYPTKKDDGTYKTALEARALGINTEYSYTPVDADSNIIKVTTKITSSVSKYSWFGFTWNAYLGSKLFKVFETTNSHYGFVLQNKSTTSLAYTILFLGYEDATNRLGRSFIHRFTISPERTFTNSSKHMYSTNADIFTAFWNAKITPDEPVEIIYYLAKGIYDPPSFYVNGGVTVKESYEVGETFSVPVKHGFAKTGRSSIACYEIYDSNGKAIEFHEVDTFTRDSSDVEKEYQYNIKLPETSGQYTIKLFSKYETFNSTSVKYLVTVQNSNAVPTLSLLDIQPDEDGNYEGSKESPIKRDHNGHYTIHAVYGIDASGANVKLNYQFWNYSDETLYSKGTLDEFTTNDNITKEIRKDIEMPEVDEIFYLVLQSVSGDKNSEEQKLYFLIYNEKIQLSFESKPPSAIEVGTEYSFVFTVNDTDDNSLLFRYTVDGDGSDDPVQFGKTEQTTKYTFKWTPTSQYVNKEVTLVFYFNDTVKEAHLTSKHTILPKTPKFELIDQIDKDRYRHDEDFVIHARYGYAESGVTVKAQYELVNDDGFTQSGELGHFVTTTSKLYDELVSTRIPLPESEGDYFIRIWVSANSVKSDPVWTMTIHIYNEPIKLVWVEPIAENVEISRRYSFSVTISDEDDTTVDISAGIGNDRSDRRTLSLTQTRSSVETFTFTAPPSTGSIEYYIVGRDSSSEVSIHRTFNITDHAPPELTLTRDVQTEIHHDKDLYVYYTFGVKRAGETVKAIYELYDFSTGQLVETKELDHFTTENGLDNQISVEVESAIPIPEEEKTYKLKLFAKVGEETSTPVEIDEIRVLNSRIDLSFAEEYNKEVHVGDECQFKIKVTDIDDNSLKFSYSINNIQIGDETTITKNSESTVYTHKFTPDDSYANKDVTITFTFGDDNRKSSIDATFKVLPNSEPTIHPSQSVPSSKINENSSGNNNDPKSRGGKTNPGKTAGIVIGVIIAILVVAAIIIITIILMKRKKDNGSANDDTNNDSIDMMNEETRTTVTGEEYATADNPLFSTADVDAGIDSDSPDGENV
ncbi:hypothetical protein TVAG_137010 [Trichomonas vaginalis G3]|uniref:Bap-like n=1 Tax=Trichomonas vaginalis (strain ATCC PRA-98 / G3) TaxID=412133 RepID=A2G5H0_TRIV3|nr:paired immunoglobulin-like type 2 receptor family [Trichomonas vaginalis G3]EAX87597.1 hypothetical protein TVAG_137010 [Trichomonas vaginalis G3]KAI5532394.1 paired immunoglobulin-like type 2 receptor family [Trichomonas vaginalis G3]|eukprot:XP_001300527.1 hypothetical protein [Trichomonas vaginalis G3]